MVGHVKFTFLQAAEQGILDCKRVIRDNGARDKKRYKNMFAKRSDVSQFHFFVTLVIRYSISFLFYLLFCSFQDSEYNQDRCLNLPFVYTILSCLFQVHFPYRHDEA